MRKNCWNFLQKPNISWVLKKKESCSKSCEWVMLQTNGAVRPRDMVIRLTPDQAYSLAQSEEVRSYIFASPFTCCGPGRDNPFYGPAPKPPARLMYGIPSYLYGFKVEIEGED